MQQRAVVETYPRGVWAAPYYFDGVPVLIAVDSRGDVRKHVKLTPDVDPEAALAALIELLDRIDPVLRLVKGDPAVNASAARAPAAHATASNAPAPAPAATPLPDPYREIEDRAAYYRRLARDAARRIPYFR